MGYTIKETIVRADRFKANGKWIETLELDMDGYYDELLVHDAVKAALFDRYNIESVDNTLRNDRSNFIIVLEPHHENSHPVTIWIK